MAEFEITVEPIQQSIVDKSQYIWARDEATGQSSYVRFAKYHDEKQAFFEVYENDIRNIPALIAALQRAQEIAAQWAESEGDDDRP